MENSQISVCSSGFLLNMGVRGHQLSICQIPNHCVLTLNSSSFICTQLDVLPHFPSQLTTPLLVKIMMQRPSMFECFPPPLPALYMSSFSLLESTKGCYFCSQTLLPLPPAFSYLHWKSGHCLVLTGECYYCLWAFFPFPPGPLRISFLHFSQTKFWTQVCSDSLTALWSIKLGNL